MAQLWAYITVYEPLTLKSALKKILLLAYSRNTRTAHFANYEPFVTISAALQPAAHVVNLRYPQGRVVLNSSIIWSIFWSFAIAPIS